MSTPRKHKWFLICKIQGVCTNDIDVSGGLQMQETSGEAVKTGGLLFSGVNVDCNI